MAFFHQAKYSLYRENDHLSSDENDPSQEDYVAGVRNPARYSQPNMFTLLSWEDNKEHANSISNSTQTQKKTTNSEVVKGKGKSKVFNRWETEAGYQYQVGGVSKPNPNHASDEKVSLVDTPTVSPESIVRDNQVEEHYRTQSVKPNVKGSLRHTKSLNSSVTKKQERLLAQKRRAQVKSQKGSRGVADSAFASAYRRPVFHNYGRANHTNPWIDHHDLESCNAQAAHAKRPEVPRTTRSANTRLKSRTSTTSGNLDTPKKTQPTSPRPQVSQPSSPKRETTVNNFDGDIDKSDQVEVRAPVVSPLVPQSYPKSAPHLGGYPSHIRAPRIRSPPQSEMPPELASFSPKQHNNPKLYKNFRPEWTSVIMAAGTPNQRGESVADCLSLFE